MSTKRWIAALAAASALLAAGCGGDDEETTTTTTAGATGATGATGAAAEAGASKAAFIEAADEICADEDEEITAEAAERFPEGRPRGEEATQFAEEVVLPSLEDTHEQIAALPQPEGEEEEIQQVLDELERGIEEGRRDPGSLLGQGNSNPLDPASQAAREFGFEQCGS